MDQLLQAVNEFHRQALSEKKYLTESLETKLNQAQSNEERLQKEVNALTNQVSALKSALDELNSKYQHDVTELRAKVSDLEQFADVSLVKSLEKTLDSTKRENDLLKKKQKIDLKPKPAIETKPAPPPAPSEAQPAPSEPQPAPSPVEPQSPAPTPAPPEPQPAPPEPQSPPPAQPEDDIIEQEIVLLDLGNEEYYFMDAANNSLYEVIGDPDDGNMGEYLGDLNEITIKNTRYLLNTHSNKFYHTNDDGEILEQAGTVANGKASFIR